MTGSPGSVKLLLLVWLQACTAARCQIPSNKVRVAYLSVAVQVTVTCARELFRADVEAADDLSLQVVLHDKCALELERFCTDVTMHNGKAQLCLERHRFRPEFRSSCRRAPLPSLMIWHCLIPLMQRQLNGVSDWCLSMARHLVCTVLQ